MPNWKDYIPPTRPVAMGVSGMVSSAHPMASAAGVDALAKGGNAFDAAVATATTLNVVEPHMSGVGGIGIALMYVAREDRVRVLNFSGRAPATAELSLFGEETKRTGILAPMVPGNVAGWLTLHETYGLLELEYLFSRAINYAKFGFPVTHLASRIMKASEERLQKFDSSSEIILGDDGKAPLPGEKLVMPGLAESLQIIARDGQKTFYQGEIAQRISSGVKNLKGLLTIEDLADYKAVWTEPISTSYKGYEIFVPPPNSSGFQILEILNLIEGFGSEEVRFQNPDGLHLLMESTKLAVADRIKYGGDPGCVKVPLSGLISKEYAAHQRSRISREYASISPGEHYADRFPDLSLEPGNALAFDGGMTTHFATADQDGNVVTVTQTLGGAFGSGVAVGDTGIFLNNMCAWFDLDENSPNCIGPRRAVDFVVAPTQTFRNGKFVLSMGTPGSWGILQTTPQLLLNVLEHGMNVQQAIDAPRFRYYTGTHVKMEERFPPEVRKLLTDLGHHVEILDPWSTTVGGAQAIKLEGEEGVYQGGADPRRDGYAFGI